jgi:HAD superfamily hydrolase (TIGR01490 family)
MPEASKSKRRVAIFDIDGTIFRSSLVVEVTEELIRQDIFPASARVFYRTAEKHWLDRQGSYDEYIDALVGAFMRHIRGVSYADFRRVARSVVTLRERRVYCYTRDLVRSLKKRGYYLLAISNSPLAILLEFCGEIGFNKVYGRMYEFDHHNRFTGRVLHEELISDKAKILKRAVLKEHLTLTGSVGVGDTESDIPFLKLVKTPICFNPNKKLYRHARRASWKVVVERKDVVYELKQESRI